jgi:hypothetical protein
MYRGGDNPGAASLNDQTLAFAQSQAHRAVHAAYSIGTILASKAGVK